MESWSLNRWLRSGSNSWNGYNDIFYRFCNVYYVYIYISLLYLYLYLYTCMHACIHTHIHTYTYTHTHESVCFHICTSGCGGGWWLWVTPLFAYGVLVNTFSGPPGSGESHGREEVLSPSAPAGDWKLSICGKWCLLQKNVNDDEIKV